MAKPKLSGVWLRYVVRYGAHNSDITWELLGHYPAKSKQARAHAKFRAEQLAREHDWSEHYRDIQWGTSRCPPRAVIAAKLSADRGDAAALRARIKLLTADIATSPTKGFCPLSVPFGDNTQKCACHGVSTKS